MGQYVLCYEADPRMIVNSSFTASFCSLRLREDVCLSCTPLLYPVLTSNLHCTVLPSNLLCTAVSWQHTTLMKTTMTLYTSNRNCNNIKIVDRVNRWSSIMNGKIMLHTPTKIEQNMQIETKTKTYRATDDIIYVLSTMLLSAHVCHEKERDVNFFCMFQVKYNLSNNDLCRTVCSV